MGGGVSEEGFGQGGWVFAALGRVFAASAAFVILAFTAAVAAATVVAAAIVLVLGVLVVLTFQIIIIITSCSPLVLHCWIVGLVGAGQGDEHGESRNGSLLGMDMLWRSDTYATFIEHSLCAVCSR